MPILMLVLTALTGFAASPKIINGEDAELEDFPMAGGSLMSADFAYQGRSFPLNMLVCSSTLIAPDVVLLAAHCVDELSITQGQGSLDNVEWAWSRQADLSDWDGTRSVSGLPDDAVAAVSWVKHEDFDLMRMGLGLSENHDIALLFLEEALTDNPLGYLPTADEGEQIAEGNEAWIVGWGQQEATEAMERPPRGTYAYKQMALTALAEIGDTELQVGPTQDGGRKCHGDSGGPTFMEVESDSTESMRVIGVTSHSYDWTDCELVGGVDTRVDAYLEWIDDQMVEACEDGTRVWCDTPGILPAPGVSDEEAKDEGEELDVLACGCDSGGMTGAWGLLLGALALRRRA